MSTITEPKQHLIKIIDQVQQKLDNFKLTNPLEYKSLDIKVVRLQNSLSFTVFSKTKYRFIIRTKPFADEYIRLEFHVYDNKISDKYLKISCILNPQNNNLYQEDYLEFERHFEYMKEFINVLKDIGIIKKDKCSFGLEL